MGDLAWGMWRQVGDSWRHRDRTVALALSERHDKMNELHASGRMTLPVAMEMTLVARFYERLGDHAVNLARRVIDLAGSAPG
jgi:phosphate transport system protein